MHAYKMHGKIVSGHAGLAVSAYKETKLLLQNMLLLSVFAWYVAVVMVLDEMR